jgi:hypothetical protein
LSRNLSPKLFKAGHDSWQAEQRSPYFLAKAGNALADWLAPRIKKINAKAAARTQVTRGGFCQKR